MPVPGDSGGIATNELENESARHGIGEALCLFGSSNGAMRPIMQGTNSESSCGRGRESQLLLNYEVPSERNDEEYAKKTSSGGKKD